MIDPSVKVALGAFVISVLVMFVNWLLSKVEPNFVERSETYKKEMQELSKILTKAFAELDKVRCELNELESNRVAKAKSLEELEREVNSRQALLEDLNKVSLPAATHFLDETRKGAKRSAMHANVLFVLGIVLGILINLILRRF